MERVWTTPEVWTQTTVPALIHKHSEEVEVLHVEQLAGV